MQQQHQILTTKSKSPNPREEKKKKKRRRRRRRKWINHSRKPLLSLVAVVVRCGSTMANLGAKQIKRVGWDQKGLYEQNHGGWGVEMIKVRPQLTTTTQQSRNLETQLISTVRNPQERTDLHHLKPTRTHWSPSPETHGPPLRSTIILSPRPTKQTHQNPICNPQPLDHDDLASVIVPTKISFTTARKTLLSTFLF